MKIWLNSLGLGQYYDQLKASGFTSLARCSALSLQALESVDFNLPGHKKRLFKAGMTCAHLRMKDLNWQSHQWLLNCVYESWISFSFALFGLPEYRIDAVCKSVVSINDRVRIYLLSALSDSPTKACYFLSAMFAWQACHKNSRTSSQYVWCRQQLFL